MIVFEQPTIRVTISNKQPHTHIFKGFNNYLFPVKIVKVTKGCSCTSSDYPEILQPNSPFEIKMTVDKTGQTGYFSTSMIVDFDKCKSQTLKINGQLES